MSKFTPFHIRLMINFYVTPMKHPQQDSPAGKEFVIELWSLGLIEEHFENESGYSATERGRIWIDMLCNTQPPKAIWADHHNNILSDRKG